jgi:hypothetical protein
MHKISQPICPRYRIFYGCHVIIGDDFRPFAHGTFYLIDNIFDQIAVLQDAPFINMAAYKNDFIDTER